MKTVNDGLRKSSKASAPASSLHDVSFPLEGGGVWGRVRQYAPITIPAAPVSWNISSRSPHPTKARANPATIQPIVPNTRISGNSLRESVTWWSASEFVRASVGK